MMDAIALRIHLRPLSETPQGYTSAAIVCVDETEGEDNIGAYLASELYIHDEAGWSGEKTALALPANARFWIAEPEINAPLTVAIMGGAQ